MIRGVLDGIKKKLHDQSNAQELDMGVINDLIKDVGVCNGKIVKNIDSLEKIDEELKKMKADFDNFLGKSKDRDGLI